MPNKTIDEIITVLCHIRMSLRSYEYECVTEAITQLENPPDLKFAKKILQMINSNEDVTLDDIKNLCERFIQSKEEELDG